ncbi:hypothetical protein ACMYR3_10620 [Ampullimonas aquatilis]|uniref:hypothetical protein n=1 Tax=Ampullimonas aquatilis TaxID=1341549 RepID=UPI003C776D19
MSHYQEPCAITDHGSEVDNPEYLMSQTLHMMSWLIENHAGPVASPISSHIIRHLQLLSQNPLLSPEFQHICFHLMTRWIEYAKTTTQTSSPMTIRHAAATTLQ